MKTRTSGEKRDKKGSRGPGDFKGIMRNDLSMQRKAGGLWGKKSQ